MGEVVRFGTKSELERARLIREARAIYESIFPDAEGPGSQNVDSQCDSRNGKQPEWQSASFAQPGGRECAEQQQQSDQPGEYRQHADAFDYAGVAHPNAHPAVAVKHAGGAHRYNTRKIDA